ncbi:MAPEG family protein [Massilia sp. B-10]|nr:MAPEG family protein [Massilia sp. B-10]UUZ56700.1 MAPEG family protein [Massilia sp. H-1]
MTTELTMLGWTLALALAQILITATLRSSETGLAYNMGPRDGPAPPMRPLTARLQRAQANLFETLPLFAAAVLIVHAAGRAGELSAWGSIAYFGARAVRAAVCLRRAGAALAGMGRVGGGPVRAAGGHPQLK